MPFNVFYLMRFIG